MLFLCNTYRKQEENIVSWFCEAFVSGAVVKLTSLPIFSVNSQIHRTQSNFHWKIAWTTNVKTFLLCFDRLFSWFSDVIWYIKGCVNIKYHFYIFYLTLESAFSQSNFSGLLGMETTRNTELNDLRNIFLFEIIWSIFRQSFSS